MQDKIKLDSCAGHIAKQKHYPILLCHGKQSFFVYSSCDASLE